MKRTLSALILLIIAFNSISQQTSFKSFPDSNGIIRCHTMELDSIRRELNSSLPTLDEHEEWLGEKIAAYKNSSAYLQKSGGIMTIPVVFHIITDGAGAENLSQAAIQSQVDQLNLDFRNLAGSTDPAAADVEIEFCLVQLDPSNNSMTEPGINRITTYGDGPFTTAFIDATIKPSTIWLPTEYFNIWVVDISGGILAYAQYPDGSGLAGVGATGGAANTDGAVALYSTIGSIANPSAFGGAYANGRSLTHEIGHWLGLRHIWGDGGCGVDDFCVDTPESDASNLGCATGHISCGSIDMIENFMDYSNDACMNVFTADQKTRITTVMTVSPRRMELLTSGKCGPMSPEIAFSNTSGSDIIESTDCSFQDFVVDLTISSEPSAIATATITLTGNTTATLGQDFDLIPSSVVFPPSSCDTQQITLRVYNDGIIESDELIELEFNVVTSGDAIATTSGNLIYTQTILNDDIAPSSAVTTTILDVNFETGILAPFTSQGAVGSDLFQIGTTASSASAFWSMTGNSTQFAFTNDDNCNCAKNNDRLTSPVFSLASAYSGVTLTFDHAFSNFVTGGTPEEGMVQISTGGAYTTIATITNTSVASGAGVVTTPWVNNVTVDLTPYIGQATVQIRFRYRDGGAWQYGMGIDNISIVAQSSLGVQETDNTASPKSSNIGGFETVHYYDVVSGDIVASIENLSAWDYQCTTMEVNRDVTAVGAFTSAFTSTIAADFLASKTYFVSPANNSPTGNYQITLYYTEAEIVGWENETGRPRTELEIIKVSNNPISLVNSGNYASYSIESQLATLGTLGTTATTLTATFNSGFSGFGIGVLNPIILPAELISFEGSAKDSKNVLSWKTANEINNSHFILRKSNDGINFRDIELVHGAGNSSELLNYQAFDYSPSPANYYQLSQFDFNGDESKSAIIFLRGTNEQSVIISPNPGSEEIVVSFTESLITPTTIELMDENGRSVARVENVIGDQYTLDISQLSSGIYQLRVSNDTVVTKKLVKL